LHGAFKVAVVAVVKEDVLVEVFRTDVEAAGPFADLACVL